MSIQKELDNVRKKNLDNQILDIFNKLNKQCQDLTGGMGLEKLLAEVERIEYEDMYPDQPDEIDQPRETEWSKCPECNEWAVPDGCECMKCGYPGVEDDGGYSTYCETCDCITTFSYEYPYGTCHCS